MTALSIDTRTLKPGDIFVALKGETFDGHDFVPEAFRKGASAAIVNRHYPRDSHEYIVVDDPLVELQNRAQAHLENCPAKRIALTGSNGKTTTKELIRCVLAEVLGNDIVIASSGNQNNHIGVPLSIFKVKPEHQVAIFEMGMNHFGEIALLASIIKPQIALITNIGTAHAGPLGGPDGIAKAKAELYEALRPQDIAIVNVDDPRCMREAEEKVKGKCISFGRAPWANVRILQQESDISGIRLTLSYQQQSESVHLPLLGTHNAQNAAAAIAVAMALNLDFSASVKALSLAKAVHGRLDRHTLSNGALLIDDTYNANPESMEAGLNWLASWPAKRRIAVLGEMAELGNQSEIFHQAIGAACAQKKIDRLFICGENAKVYSEGACNNGMSPSQIIWTANSEELAGFVQSQIQAGDVIWVKGSRVTQMEKVVLKLQNI